MAEASENGIYLRLPGQWENNAWADATSGGGDLLRSAAQALPRLRSEELAEANDRLQLPRPGR